MRATLATAVLAALVATAWPGVLQSPQEGRLQRWVDDDGVIRYSDAAVGASGRADFTTDPAAVARTAELSLHEDGGVYVALVRNLLQGPIQVQLDISEHDNVTAWPRLPHRMVLEAGEQRSVTALERINPARPSQFELHLMAIPGRPGEVHQGIDYLLPVSASVSSIAQGFGGGFSHTDPQNYHAIDFAVPEGTPVLAARDGTVMQVVDDHVGGGLDRATFAHRANFVRILHTDGSMAVYAHLRHRGARVRAGQRVFTGEHIGDSGNTGFSSGPHLHFVTQVNTGMALESVPVDLVGADGRRMAVSEEGRGGPGARGARGL